jgi:hypothetical protein
VCLTFTAFGGDISCDFETEQWDEGYCNWRYDFASTDVFTWETSPTSDLILKKRWQYGMDKIKKKINYGS